jgi:hypothetical protein
MDRVTFQTDGAYAGGMGECSGSIDVPINDSLECELGPYIATFAGGTSGEILQDKDGFGPYDYFELKTGHVSLRPKHVLHVETVFQEGRRYRLRRQKRITAAIGTEWWMEHRTTDFGAEILSIGVDEGIVEICAGTTTYYVVIATLRANQSYSETVVENQMIGR